MVRIARFHRADSGSIPDVGRLGAAKMCGGDYATVKDVGDVKGIQIQYLH